MMLPQTVLNGFNIPSVNFLKATPYLDQDHRPLPRANYYFNVLKEECEFYVRLESNKLDIFFLQAVDVTLPSFMQEKINQIKLALKEAYITFLENSPEYRLLYTTGLLDIRIH